MSDNTPEKLPEGCDLAIAAEAFYITNMALAPGLGFVMLLGLYFHCARKKASPVALNHLRQTLSASFWTGAIAAVFLGLIFATGGYPSPWFWPLLGTYFLVFHIPLTYLGIVGLNRALGGEDYRYPVVGMPMVNGSPAAA